MKQLLPYFFLLYLNSINIDCISQTYRNCTVTFHAVGKDSMPISAHSKEATVEINMQSGELILKVKIRSFTTENIGLANELKEHNEKLIFRGNLQLEPGRELSNQRTDIPHKINGSTKINGIRVLTPANYSIFQKSNSAGNNQPPLLTFDFTVSLSDFNIEAYYPEIMNEVKISLIRQPLNIILD